MCWGNVRCLKKPLPPIYTWLILFPRGAKGKGKGGAWEERRNTKLVCRGMKVLVRSHRSARAPAAPRRASGWQHLHALLGKFLVCMEGLCTTPALSLQFLHFQKPKHLHVVMGPKTPGQCHKTLLFSLDRLFSQKRRHHPENVIVWTSHHLVA